MIHDSLNLHLVVVEGVCEMRQSHRGHVDCRRLGRASGSKSGEMLVRVIVLCSITRAGGLVVVTSVIVIVLHFLSRLP